MSNLNTGGPAFPHEYFDKQLKENRVMAGMTLRDYFAAKAMQAFIWRAVVEMDMEDVVVDAYEMADVMLHHRHPPSAKEATHGIGEKK